MFPDSSADSSVNQERMEQQEETQTKNICFTYFLLAIICTRYLFIKCFIYSYVHFLLFQDV